MPSVSVIITTHSRPHLLPRAVESAQKAGTDVEVIVVDDASTDETAEVCRNLKGIKYVRAERNQRVAGARNLGILASTAEYISFLDDDDVRLLGTLDEQVEILNTNPEVGLVYGKMHTDSINHVPTGRSFGAIADLEGDVFWDLLVYNFIPVMSAVFRKSCLYKVGLLDETIPGIDDYDLWVRIAELYQVRAIDKFVAIWRGPTPTSDQGSTNVRLWLLAAKIQKEKWLKLPRSLDESPGRRHKLRRKFLDHFSDALIWEGHDLLKQGYADYARKKVLVGFQLQPLRAIRPWTIQLLFQTYC